jgi:hypothetical protein
MRAPLSLSLPGVRFTPEATINLAAIPHDRRMALLHGLGELAAVANLALHGNDAGIMAGVPLQIIVDGLRATYDVSEDHQIVILRIEDQRVPHLRIV